MIKKYLLALVIMAVAAGGAFAQTDFETMPKNTVVVDFGPTVIGGLFSVIGPLFSGGAEEGLNSSGFGIAGQYERQLLEQLTVGGKIGYLATGLGLSIFEDSKINIDITSFTIEAHVRFYPLGGTFFLDGMLGYANMALTLKGSFPGFDENDNKKTVETKLTIPRDYLNLGAKIGWRIDFGKPGGFVFEPSFGWYGCIGLGDTIGTGLMKTLKKDTGIELAETDMTAFDAFFSLAENFFFVGGVRFTLSFGWRF